MGGVYNDDNWDVYGDLELNYNWYVFEMDKLIVGFLVDFKECGMFEDILIVWGGEFGC